MAYRTFRYGFRAIKLPEPIARAVWRVLELCWGEYTPSVGIERIASAVPVSRGWTKPLFDQLLLHNGVGKETIRLLDDVVLNHSQVFQKSFKGLELPINDGDIIVIPDEFKGIADLEGDGIGAGEALLPVLLRNQVVWHKANDRYDFTIDGELWHFKDHRSGNSTPMGNTRECEEMFRHSIFMFMDLEMGISPQRFSVGDFADNPRVEAAVKLRYGTDDLFNAAQAFEDELQAVFRRSAYIGDAVGILYLELLPNGIDLAIRRVNRDSICLYERGGRGVKSCAIQNRFADAITNRLRKELEAQRIRQERDVRAAERRLKSEKLQEDRRREREAQRAARTASRLLAKQARLKSIEEIRQKKLEAKRDLHLEQVRLVAYLVSRGETIKAIAKELQLSQSTVSKLKKEAVAGGHLQTAEEYEISKEIQT